MANRVRAARPLRLAVAALLAATVVTGIGLAPEVAVADPGTFVNVHSFAGGGPHGDQGSVNGGLAEGLDGNLYGAGATGDAPDCLNQEGGALFSVDPNSLAYRIGHAFMCAPDGTTLTGAGQAQTTPIDGGDGYLYGTLHQCPTNGLGGALYRMHPDGSGYSLLRCYGSDHPAQFNEPSQLMRATDGDLYGLVRLDSSACAAVIRIVPGPSPTVQTVVANLCAADSRIGLPAERNALVQGPDGTLYGNTEMAFFSVTVDPGTGVGTVHFLHALTPPAEGSDMEGALTFGPDGALYGTTTTSSSGDGEVFRITTTGTFRVIAELAGPHLPLASTPFLPNGLLVSTTWAGGADNEGTLFAADQCGNTIVLHNFGDSAGSLEDPLGAIVVLGDDIWGATQQGGAAEDGGIWRYHLDAAPESVALTSAPSASGVTLTATGSWVGGTLSGSVTFYDGSTALGSSAMVNGVATLSPTLGGGTHHLHATYCGVASPPIDVTPTHPTAVTYTGPAHVTFHDPATLSGTLSDTSSSPSTPVSGRSLTLAVGADGCANTTDATGTTACTATITGTPGPATATVTFAGDGSYDPSATSVPVTVDRAPTTLVITGPTHLANGSPATLAATLTEHDTGAAIAGRHVALTLGGGTGAQTCTGTTDASGNADCTLAAVNQPAAATIVTIGATFTGDTDYLPQNTSSSAPLLYYTGRAFDASLTLVGLPLIPPFPDTGSIQTSIASTTNKTLGIPLGSLGSITVLDARVTTGAGKSTGKATVGAVNLTIPGVGTIVATTVAATSTSTCTAATGSTTIAKLVINGKAILTTNLKPNSVIQIGAITLTLDQQAPVPGADHGLTVTAIHLSVPGVADVQIGSARSDIHQCAAVVGG
jgi:hypothetical protein